MWTMFEEELKKINAAMGSDASPDIPTLFRRIPLDEFGKLLLNIPDKYPHMKSFFPSMATREVQRNWTGAEGQVLLNQSLIFVQTMISGYAAITGKKIRNARILDYGCGWGRLIRPLYKYIPAELIFGVDPWDESIKECERHGLLANLALSDWVPQSLPFDTHFDLIYAFSVFTHLSEKTAYVVLRTLRKNITEDGLLVITIRPKEYWNIHDQGALAPQMIEMHDKKGFAFTPHNRVPIDGDITYGDTSMSLAYFENHYPQWKIQSVECNSIDSHQVILFLIPT